MLKKKIAILACVICIFASVRLAITLLDYFPEWHEWIVRGVGGLIILSVVLMCTMVWQMTGPSRSPKLEDTSDCIE